MKQKTSFFLKTPVLCITLLCAVLASSIFRGLRGYWVFYDPNMAFLGGSMGMFIITLVIIALLIGITAMRLYAPEKMEAHAKAWRITGMLAFILTALFFIADLVLLIFGGGETFGAFWLVFKKDLLYILPIAAVGSLLLFLPCLRAKGRAILSVCMALCIGCSALWMLFPIKSYHFVSAPVVMDTGEEYAVVFATNDTGTAYVHYTYEGKEYTVYAQNNGRRIGDRLIHSIHVPYAHLNNNRYDIGSTRVIEQYGYGSRLGKTVNAGPYTLRVNEGATQTYLCISDWHSYIKKAKAAIGALGAYDAVIMLGDPNTNMEVEEQAVQYIVQFGGDITGGEMPVIFVRGNHETRGAFAAALPEYLGYNKLYYTVKRGEYSFLILDSGEDKPDDHVEYGEMDSYEYHRAEMLEWLQTKPQITDKLVVLSHAWQVSEPEPEVSRAAWDVLQDMGARFMISGHKHVCEFLEDDRDEEAAPTYLKAYPSITTYIDGGHRDNAYVASKLTLSETGVHFEAANNRGETVMDKTLPW